MYSRPPTKEVARTHFAPCKVVAAETPTRQLYAEDTYTRGSLFILFVQLCKPKQTTNRASKTSNSS